MTAIRAIVPLLTAIVLIASVLPFGGNSALAQRTKDRSGRKSGSHSDKTTEPSKKNVDRSETGGFAAYEIIVERNVFDPNRSPSRRKDEAGDASVPTPAPQSVDLLGTWVTDRQAVAFIEGAGADLNGAPGVGDQVAGWKIAGIDTENVALEKQDRKLTWPVGRRLERTQSGEWELGGTASPQTAQRLPTSAGSSSAPAGAGESSGSDDILKLMRERRQREMKK